jgi:predicted negative regulator of RcsB-dependent stress response
LLARESVSKNNYPAAETHLNWVVDTAHDAALRQMARIRLARVLLADNKSKEALKILNTVDDPIYLPLIEDVKGDIFVSQGNAAQAKVSYAEALQNAPELVSIYPLLQMKLDNLNGSALAGTAL